MTIHSLLNAHGQEVEDPEEGMYSTSNPFFSFVGPLLYRANAKASALIEAFLIFSQSIPSHNLGFVDSKAARLDLTIADRELSIVQSPTILSSNRGGGTTGAGKYSTTTLRVRLPPYKLVG